MKAIVAQDQVRLSLARCFQLALSGMSHRMFRASVTVAILALAVAFLTHMLSFAILERETRQRAYLELQATERLGQTLSRLSRPDARAAVVAALAQAEPARLAEYAGWASAAPVELRAAVESAGRRAASEAYLGRLPPAPRAALLGDLEPRELLDALGSRADAERVVAQLGAYGAQPPLGDRAAFTRLIAEEQPRLFAFAQRVVAGHERAIASVLRDLGGRKPSDWAASAPPEAKDALGRAGFRFPGIGLRELSAFAREDQELRRLEAQVLEGPVRQRIARETEIPLGDIGLASALEYVAGHDARGVWLSEVLREARGAPRWEPARLQQLSEHRARERQLTVAVGSEPPSEPGFFGMSQRNRWLVALSFLVCVVGVANAMLMSVTERFTEIATMKCLGAMDGFVMTMFVIEAVIQGAVGGAAGLLLGLLLAALRALAEYGSLAGSGLAAAGDVLAAMGIAFASGILLSALAAIGPSLLASRLAPMEAMRVD